jgi:hypothetical protein
MSKVIEVNKCGDCPYFDRVISPDTEMIIGATCLHPDGQQNVWLIAAKIPEWCPLEDSEDFAESNFDIDRKF